MLCVQSISLKCATTIGVSLSSLCILGSVLPVRIRLVRSDVSVNKTSLAPHSQSDHMSSMRLAQAAAVLAMAGADVFAN